MLCLTALSLAAAAAPLHTGKETFADRYIVVFHKDSAKPAREAHIDLVKKLTADTTDSYELTRQFDFRSFYGYAASLSKEMLDTVRADDKVVEFVEQEQVYRTATPVPKHSPFVNATKTKAGACQMELEATWGIVRTAQRELTNNGEYEYNDANLGEGVSAYIIDTGIYTEHVEFEGRAIEGTNTADPPATGDGNGHGTHVAGTVGSVKYGIAKKATLVGVRVLGADGSGSTAGVIEGVEWSCKDHEAKRNRCVANLSLGGGFSLAMNRAVNELSECGCATAVASGNEARDACLASPASADGVITVNAMDSTDSNSYFSNYGSCTDIYAPGSGITSTWVGSRFAINTISGTSMASPHVAGVMALYAEDGDPSQAIYDTVIRTATQSKISKIPNSATPNLLVFKSCA